MPASLKYLSRLERIFLIKKALPVLVIKMIWVSDFGRSFKYFSRASFETWLKGIVRSG